MTATYEAFRITYQSSEQAARAAFEQLQAALACKACPVSAGTHKPADAVHTEIAEPSTSAKAQTVEKLAQFFESMQKSSHRWYDGVPVHEKAAATLRAQEAELSTLRAQVAELAQSCVSLQAFYEGAATQRDALLDGVRKACEALEAKAQGVVDADVQKGLERMTAGRASFFMERFLREEKLLGPNEQAALHYVIAMLEATAPSPAVPAPAPDARDAERLDWLVSEDNCVVSQGVNGYWLCWIDEDDSSKSEYQKGSFPTSRAAIDAAIAAQAKGAQA